jgi:thioredoxin reductase (NADPH)
MRNTVQSPAPQQAETPDATGAHPRLTAAQIATLEHAGRRRETVCDEVLIREGDVDYDFFVVLAGSVATLDESGPEPEEIAVHGPGRFLGELSLLTGQAAPFTAVVREPGTVLQVPADRLRDLATRDTALSDLILRAFMLRRSVLIGLGAGLRIIGSRHSPDRRRLCDFAARNRIPHSWIDLEDDPSAEAALQRLGVPPEDTPLVIVRGDLVLRNPSNEELGRVLGLRDAGGEDRVCELIVVGAGPAGLAASVYGASEGLDTVTLDGVATGGQAATSSRIENYLGFPAGVSGGELADRATIQARKFGADVVVPAEAVALEPQDGCYEVRLRDGGTVRGRTVVVATGARYRRLPIPRLEEFEPTCVYYAATQMEARMCVGDPVAIVGGGNSAGQAAVFLSRTVARISLIVREPDLSVRMSRYLADRIARLGNVDVLLHHELRELQGDGDSLDAVVAEDNRSGERQTIPARALFIFIGAEPHTDWLGGHVALDSGGYVLTGADTGRDDATYLETSLPGVLAVGDVRHGSIMRVASAVGEGAIAVKLVHDHLGRSHGALQRAPAAASA